MKNTVLIGVWALFLLSCTCISTSTSSNNTAISAEDRIELEIFLRDLLFSRGFAYTLFGDKPISIEEFDIENAEKPELFRTRSDGYRLWEKYACHFPKENYLFLFCEDVDMQTFEITLINTKAFRQIVNDHKEEFSGVFGANMNSEMLLRHIINKQSLWNTLIKDRNDLIGLLLGYGKRNSELFRKKSEILMRNGLKKKRLQPSQGYQSVEEELEALNSSLQSFSNEGRATLCFMRLPGFMADPKHDETLQLKKKYRQQRKLITQRYAKGKILDSVLEQLCSND